jgi:hypothetical protein
LLTGKAGLISFSTLPMELVVVDDLAMSNLNPLCGLMGDRFKENNLDIIYMGIIGKDLEI